MEAVGAADAWERLGPLTTKPLVEHERERIAKAVSSLSKTLGARPAGWYCRTAPSVNTRRLLVEHGGFTYDSDAYNDELPYWTPVELEDGRIVHHLVLHLHRPWCFPS